MSLLQKNFRFYRKTRFAYHNKVVAVIFVSIVRYLRFVVIVLFAPYRAHLATVFSLLLLKIGLLLPR